MKEIDVQREMIEACFDLNGTGNKLSNRFLTGVCDLLLKLPDWSAALIEVKITEAPKVAASIPVTLTMPQLRFLRKYSHAGMIAGVASCVTRGKEFGIAILPVSDFVDAPVRVLLEVHRWCPMGPAARKQLMGKELTTFLQQESK